MNLLIYSPNVKALSATVIIVLDKHDIDITVEEPFISKTFTVTGNVTCEFDDALTEEQYIEVLLNVGSMYQWITGVAPSLINFYESGKQQINLTFEVPDDVTYNESVNLIAVGGDWETAPFHPLLQGGSGKASTDYLNVTVTRKPHTFLQSESDEIENVPEDFSQAPPDWVFIGLFVTPVLVISGIILWVKKRKKRVLDTRRKL